jgi:hypothetical protein
MSRSRWAWDVAIEGLSIGRRDELIAIPPTGSAWAPGFRVGGRWEPGQGLAGGACAPRRECPRGAETRSCGRSLTHHLSHARERSKLALAREPLCGARLRSMSELSSAVCSITRTQRRRFFWAAWWTGTPLHTPFRRPDASSGGAKTPEQALADAVRAAGRHLVIVEPYWARAWNCVLRGEAVPPLPAVAPRPVLAAAREPSGWTVLGVEPGASLPELKRAFQRRALETHPDQGGDAAAFRSVLRAYQRLAGRISKRGVRRTPARRA